MSFSVKLAKREAFYEKVAAWFGEGRNEIGHKEFDSKFEIATSDARALNALLNVHLPDPQSSNLMTDLLTAAENYNRVRLSDRAVELGLIADPGQTDLVAPAIEQAIHLASKVDLAANR